MTLKYFQPQLRVKKKKRLVQSCINYFTSGLTKQTLIYFLYVSNRLKSVKGLIT